mmetsp:Transcript_40521/g.96297  ORF Transcript_40521/g.96297 Transcript_40521/m.96297 type:complete len:258 (-) Transcript_40521:327-1100(-)
MCAALCRPVPPQGGGHSGLAISGGVGAVRRRRGLRLLGRGPDRRPDGQHRGAARLAAPIPAVDLLPVARRRPRGGPRGQGHARGCFASRAFPAPGQAARGARRTSLCNRVGRSRREPAGAERPHQGGPGAVRLARLGGVGDAGLLARPCAGARPLRDSSRFARGLRGEPHLAAGCPDPRGGLPGGRHRHRGSARLRQPHDRVPQGGHRCGDRSVVPAHGSPRRHHLCAPERLPLDCGCCVRCFRGRSAVLSLRFSRR